MHVATPRQLRLRGQVFRSRGHLGVISDYHAAAASRDDRVAVERVAPQIANRSDLSTGEFAVEIGRAEGLGRVLDDWDAKSFSHFEQWRHVGGMPEQVNDLDGRRK